MSKLPLYPEEPQTLTAADVKDALYARYHKPSQGREGEQYVCLTEARSGAGFRGNDGQCDFLAINTWQGRGMELIGHEVKVSMSDWHAELDQPEKAERFARFCARWYVAAPSELAKKIRHEVPPAWGLLSVASSGRVTETVPPQRRAEVDEVPAWWWVGWLAQIDRQHKRRLPGLIADGMREERESLIERVTHEVEQRHRYTTERLSEKAGRLDKLSEAVGVDLERRWIDLDRLRQALTFAADCPPGLAPLLRKAADAFDAIASES